MDIQYPGRSHPRSGMQQQQMSTVMLSLFQAVSHTSISQRLGTHPPHPSQSRPAGYVKWPGATRCSSTAALSNSAVFFVDYGCQHCDHSMIHNQQNSPMKLITHRGHLHPLTNLHNLVCGGCLDFLSRQQLHTRCCVLSNHLLFLRRVSSQTAALYLPAYPAAWHGVAAASLQVTRPLRGQARWHAAHTAADCHQTAHRKVRLLNNVFSTHTEKC